MCGYDDGYFGKGKESDEDNYTQEYEKGRRKREEMVREVECRE